MKQVLFLSMIVALAVAAMFSGWVDVETAVPVLFSVGNVTLTESELTNRLMNTVKATAAAFGDGLKELRQEVIDLRQQQNVRGAPLGAAAGPEILNALNKSSELSEMARLRHRGSVFIPVPAAALQIKNTITGPVTPGEGALQHPDRADAVVVPARRRMTIRALLPSVPTSAGATSYARRASFTNAAAVQGGDSSPLEKEGARLPESAITFEFVTGPVATIGHWIPASDQVLSDLPAADQLIRDDLRYGLALEEEDQLLNGSGSGGNLEGIRIAATAYNRGATADTRADTLRKAATQLALADHPITGYVINPADEEALDLLKDSQNQYLRVKIGGRVWDVPVVSTNSIAAGTWLAGDFMSAVLRPRDEALIEISNSHDDFFVRKLVAIRATMREALEIHRPAGFVTGSF